METKAWKSTPNAVYEINDHRGWSTKYRKGVRVPPIDTEFKEILVRSAEEHGYEVLRREVRPDHVHGFLSASPAISPAVIAKVLKGTRARRLFMAFPHRKRQLWGGHWWSPSYDVGTAGHVRAETIKRYIEEPKTHADADHQGAVHADPETERVLRAALFGATKVDNGLSWHLRRQQEASGRVDVRRSPLNRLLTTLPRAQGYYALFARLTRDEVRQAWRAGFLLRTNGHPAHNAPGFRPKPRLSDLTYVQSGIEVAGDRVTLSLGKSREEGCARSPSASAIAPAWTTSGYGHFPAPPTRPPGVGKPVWWRKSRPARTPVRIGWRAIWASRYSWPPSSRMARRSSTRVV
jgi:putative transposase